MTELQLHALTHALHYGSSVFEGIRVYPTPRGPAVFRLREHIERLLDGARRVRHAACPTTPARCARRWSRRCGRAGARRAYVRPLAFFGGETVRLNPGKECPVHVMIGVLPFDGMVPGTERAAVPGHRLALHEDALAPRCPRP